MNTPNPLPIRSRAGFSMAELLATLTILGILIMLGWPRLSVFSGIKKRSSAINQLAADLTFARMSAIRAGAESQIKLNVAGTGYTVVVRNTTGAMEVVKTVRLTSEYPGLTVAPAGDSVVFDSRGLRRSATSTKKLYVAQTTGTVTTRDSVVISPLGKVSRAR